MTLFINMAALSCTIGTLRVTNQDGSHEMQNTTVTMQNMIAVRAAEDFTAVLKVGTVLLDWLSFEDVPKLPACCCNVGNFLWE